jgi:hypothetical protein
LAPEHKRGNRFHACALRLGDAALLLAEMNHFHLEPLRVERGGDVLFSGDAHRASGVVEYGFCFRTVSVCFGCSTPRYCDAPLISHGQPKSERGHYSVGRAPNCARLNSQPAVISFAS